MIRLSPEQVLAGLKQDGSYDAMRREMFKAFNESGRGKELEKQIVSLLERFSGDSEVPTRGRSKEEGLERRILGYLERQSRFERLEKDARNYWLKRDKKELMKRNINNAMDKAQNTDSPERLSHSVSRALELEPPRLPAHGSGAQTRVHSFYRVGDAAAAFVPVDDSFLSSSPQYTCVSVEVESCDAPKNMYMVRDPDSSHQGPMQDVWAVYWDQLIALKRPYDHKHREGDQVYALYRNDLGTDTAVSTEFFPGRVERVSQMSVAIRFDTGELAHVYYDELFAAGRVGFLRQQSEERKRRGASDAMVEVHGRVIPSFTGFWPGVAQPGLGKHGRKTRYRQMPPLLVDVRLADKYYLRNQLQYTRKSSPSAVCESDKNSDMDTASSSVPPESPALKASVQDRSAPHAKQQTSARDNASEHSNNQPSLSPKPTHPVSSEEDGEIDAEANEEGECVDERPLAASPRARNPSSSRRYSDYYHRTARRQPPHSRNEHYQAIRHDRPPSRGRLSRFDDRDRDRSPYRPGRDEWSTDRRSSGYRDGGYRERRRSRSRSHSRGRGRADAYDGSQIHMDPRVLPNGHPLSPPPQPPLIINPFPSVEFNVGVQHIPPQDRVDMRDSPYQHHPRQPDRRYGDYHHQR